MLLAPAVGEGVGLEIPADDARGTTWRYEIEPTASGSRVTESPDSPILDGEFFQKMNHYDLLLKSIARTLDDLKRSRSLGRHRSW